MKIFAFARPLEIFPIYQIYFYFFLADDFEARGSTAQLRYDSTRRLDDGCWRKNRFWNWEILRENQFKDSSTSKNAFITKR